jgi:NADP-reducing hydrogenase subunit HndB
VRQTGSLGLDHAEPTVEVRTKDMPTVIYGRVTPAVARRIVQKHILGKELLEDHIFDRPAPDIVEE